MSPTARSLAYLREAGFLAEVVEKWIPGANIRKDYLGVIDILGFRPGSPVMVGVQATSKSNVSSRVTKAAMNPNLNEWLRSGHEFWVWGWDKRVYRDGGRPRWEAHCRRINYREEVWEVYTGDNIREALERCTPLR